MRGGVARNQDIHIVKTIYKVLIVVAVAALAVGAWFAFSDKKEGQVQLLTVGVERGDFVNKVQATGTLEPQELVDVGAQVTGEIKEFGVDVNGKRVDYGSEVKAGQLLARIDDTLVELNIKRAEASVAQAKAQILSAAASVTQAKASIAQAQANTNKADRDLARAKKLGVGVALSQMDYDQYVTAAESSAASLESAKAQLNTAEAQQASAAAQLQSSQAQLESEMRNRDYTRITTPVDGTIVVRQVNVGQTVVSSMNATTLFLVARDLAHMQIWASVNEADIAKVHPGQEVRYTVDALPNETFTGKVNKIRPNATMSSNVVTYIVEVDIENPERRLMPYMSANANFIVEEIKDCLMVPDNVFDFRPAPELIVGELPRREEGVSLIWKAVGDKVAPVQVKRGIGNGTRTVISPLHEGALTDESQIVYGVSMQTRGGAAQGSNGQNNLFGMNRPQRRQRSTGGAEAKAGQTPDNSRPGPPPM